MSKQGNSILLIEECLDQIYRCRRSALLVRSKKFKAKEERTKLNSSERNNTIMSSARYRNIENSVDFEDEEDVCRENDRELLKELSVKFSAPPVKSVPYITTPKDFAAVTDIKISGDDSEADAVAEKAFVEFSEEITSWLHNHSKEVVGDDDIRAELADHLVHSYLSSNLDLLPSSRRVSEIRRLIASTVEDFVSSGSIRLSVSALKQHNNIVRTLSTGKSGENVENTGGGAQNKKTTASIPNTVHFSSDAPANATVKPLTDTQQQLKKAKKLDGSNEKQRAAAEKDKIKVQYENFMALKRQADNHPDHHTVQEYSALNDDIQSLLSSLQTKT